jgi:hypothetical protein
MIIEEISPSGLRLHTGREVDPGTVLKVTIPSYDFEATAIVEAVWRDGGQHSVGLKLIEPSDGWQKVWEDNNQ